MADTGLKIVLDAETSKAVKGIETVTKSLQAMPAAAAKASQGINAINKASANATPTLINFGRVIQDAPFGLIGIANNIDPLISSFQSLKASTGSTGLAFKALAGSLIGPAGIGIAVSAVTSALIAFGPKLFGASKEAKELDKALTGVAENASQDLVKLQSYVLFAQDATKATSERKKAVDALQKEYPQYLKNISDEAILTGKATEAINASINAILRKAVVKLLQDEIAAAVEDTAKKIIAIQKKVTAQQIEAEQQAEKTANKVKSSFDEQAFAAIKSGRAVSDAANGFTKLNNEGQRLLANKPETLIENLKNELLALVLPINKIAVNFEDIGKSADEGLKKAGKAAKEVKDVIRSLIQEGLNEVSGNLAFNRLIIEAAVKFSPAQAKKDAEELVKFVNTPGVVPPITLRMDADISALLAKLKAAEDAVRAAAAKFDADVNAALQSTLVNAATGIADAIASAIEGKGNIFGSLLTVVASAMKDFGKALIAIGTGVLVAKKSLATNPAAAIAAGFVLTIAGAALQAAIPKFAEGGIITGPTIGMIGEAGPEVVFPLSDLQKFVSGERQGGQVVVLQTAIRGSDLLLIQQRAGSSFKRTNG